MSDDRRGKRAVGQLNERGKKKGRGSKMGESMLRKIFLAGPYDLKAVEEYLEEMAEKGYLFVKQRGIFYYFEKCEPKKVHFAVDIFEKASVFDTRPEAKTEEYIDYCEKCGWKFIYSNGKIQFFYSEEENPVPIQTDDAYKLKMINKNVLLTKGSLWLCWIYLILLQFLSAGFRKMNGATMVEQYIMFGTNLSLLIAYGGMFLFIIVDVVRYLRFYRRNKKRIKNGESLQYIEKKQVEKYHKITCVFLLCLLFALLFPLCFMGTMGYVMIGVILLCVFFIYFIEMMRQGNKKMSRQDNVVVTFVATIAGTGICIIGLILSLILNSFDYHTESVKYYDQEEKSYVYTTIGKDEIPFTMEEFGIYEEGVKYNETTAYDYASVFGTYDIFEQVKWDETMQQVGPSFQYEVVKSKWDKLRNSYVDNFLGKSSYETKDITKEEGTLWGAKKVYSLWDKENEVEERLVLYDEKVVYLSCEELSYNTENILKIKNALE